MGSWTTRISAFLNPLLDYLYPPYCLACHARFGPDTHYFCAACLLDLDPPPPALRCRHCFHMHERAPNPCSRCAHHPLLTAPRAWVFDESPASHALKAQLHRNAHLYEAVAGLARLQLERLHWDDSDLVIPLPDPLHARFRTAHRALASHIAQLLNAPYRRWLCRRSTRPFVWRLFLHPEALLEGRRVLLLDVASQPRWIAKALGHLQCGHPRDIRVLALFEPKEYTFSP